MTAASPGGAHAPTETPATVLLVDASPHVREVIGEILRAAGYAVREAATGTAGLELARDGPDLIVLDINLPDVDGIEVCRRIKRDPVLAAIPVLHVSGAHRPRPARGPDGDGERRGRAPTWSCRT